MKNFSLREMHEASCRVKDRFPQIAVLGIPWLHATNPREMSNRLESKKMRPVFLFLCARLFFALARGFQWSALIFYLRMKHRGSVKAIVAEKFDGVAKTWFVHKKEGESGDFYLGDLQQRLKKRGLNVLWLYGNVTANHWRDFASQAISKGDSMALPELCLIAPWHPFGMVFQQMVAAFCLYFAAWIEKDPLIRDMLDFASVDSLRAQTTLNALNYPIGKNVARRFQPKFFISLFEGHGWEKCLALGVRRQSPACQIIGYQHTVIMSHNYETFEPRHCPRGKTIPDVVLSVGYKGCELMRTGHEKFGTKLIPFGSFRYSPSFHHLREPDGERKNILVIPEGIWEEAIYIFDAIWHIARALKEHHFILRCHPVLPYDRVRTRLSNDPLTLPNVELSRLPNIEDDFHRSAAAIYRGSSSILYGILLGLKPFYLGSPRLKKIDPLFDLSDWKEFVEKRESAPERIGNFFVTPLSARKTSWKIAAQYVQDYIIPVDERSVDRFVGVLH